MLGNPSSALGMSWCINQEASADVNQIQCLNSLDACPKSIDVPHAIKKGFDKIARRRKICTKCKAVTVNEEKYLDLYQLPFLVTAITLPDRGGVSGFDVHVIFKERPEQEFEVGMFCADEGGYELQSIIDGIPSKKMKQLIKTLSQKEYAQYWIRN